MLLDLSFADLNVVFFCREIGILLQEIKEKTNILECFA